MADFTSRLVGQLQAANAADDGTDLPAYNYGDSEHVADDLAAPAVLRSFRLGTGASVFSSALVPALLTARQEILLVTCFWASSPSLDGLSAALTQLADLRRAAGFSSGSQPPLRIRIGFSSRSLLQKLLHTSSRDGHVYPPATWTSQLGLPPADRLREAGIDLAVKSLFFRPFSVMHPKFVMIDRQRAFLPSCNVSWESWLEGCVEITGPALRPLLLFYTRTWGDDLPDLQDLPESVDTPDRPDSPDRPDRADTVSPASTGPLGPSISPVSPVSPVSTPLPEISPLDVEGPGTIVVRFPASSSTPTVLLPSSHHCNPHFHPLPWQNAPTPPPTPLNLALLLLFAQARSHIYVQTPNLTAEPAISALLDALARGVHVHVVTCRRMMIYEQLVTAGTTTEWCIRSFIRRYEALQPAGQTETGKLNIAFFCPFRHVRGLRNTPSPQPDEEQAILPAASAEPVQSHLKLTIVDGEHTVLGSGNLDRASWFTSQELGILFHDSILATAVKTALDRVLEGRLEPFYETSRDI